MNTTHKPLLIALLVIHSIPSPAAEPKPPAKKQSVKVLRAEDARLKDTLARIAYGRKIRSAWTFFRIRSPAEAQKLLADCNPKYRGFEWEYLKRLFVKPHLTLKGHRTVISALAISSDSKMIASGAVSGNVRVWDAATGKQTNWLRARADGSSGGILELAFNADDSRIIARAEKELVCWNVKSGKQLWTSTTRIPATSRLAVSPSGQLFAVGYKDGVVRLHDVKSGESRHELQGNKGRIHTLQFSKDGKRLLASAHDRTTRVLDVERRKVIGVVNHDRGAKALFSPDRREILAFHGAEIDMWSEFKTKPRIRENYGGQNFAFGVNIPLPGGRFDIERWRNTIRVLDWTTNSTEFVIVVESSRGPHAFAPNGRYIAINDKRLEVRIATIASVMRKHHSRETVFNEPSCGDFSDDGRFIATTHGKRGVQLRKADSGELIGEFGANQSPFAISKNGHLFCARPANAKVKLGSTELLSVDVKTRKSRVIAVSRSFPFCIASTKNGETLAIAGRDGEIAIVDTKSGRTRRLSKPEGAYVRLSFSPDGKYLLSSAASGELKLWNISTGKTMYSRKIPYIVWNLDFSPDGRRFATVGGWKHPRIWNTNTGKTELILYGGPTMLSTGIAFSPDGERLAVAGRSPGVVVIWDAKTAHDLVTLDGQDRAGFSVRFSSDGKQIISKSNAGGIVIWDSRVPK